MMTPRLLLFIIIFCVLIAPSGLCRDAEEEFAYDSGGKRDPFIPLITDKTRFGVGLVGVETIDDISLEGIVYDPVGNSFAILNGIILEENEQVNNVRITKIEPERISIAINEREFTINLVKEEEEE